MRPQNAKEPFQTRSKINDVDPLSEMVRCPYCYLRAFKTICYHSLMIRESAISVMSALSLLCFSFTSESERFKLKQKFSNFINALQIFDASNILKEQIIHI